MRLSIFGYLVFILITILNICAQNHRTLTTILKQNWRAKSRKKTTDILASHPLSNSYRYHLCAHNVKIEWGYSFDLCLSSYTSAPSAFSSSSTTEKYTYNWIDDNRKSKRLRSLYVILLWWHRYVAIAAMYIHILIFANWFEHQQLFHQ